MRLVDWIVKSDSKNLRKLRLDRVDVDSERPIKIRGQGIRLRIIPFDEWGSRDGDEFTMTFTKEQVWALDIYREYVDTEPLLIKVTKNWVDIWLASPAPMLESYRKAYSRVMDEYASFFLT